MPIAAAVTAPPAAGVLPPRHASPPPQPRAAPRREQSPLNPSSQAIRSASGSPPPPAGGSSAATEGSRATIANLDRVLGKPPQVPRPAAAAAANKQEQQQDGELEPLNVRHGLLNALNLSFFVPMPGMRARTAADEHMSPRSLMHMQQLLSADSPRASPRSTIAQRWRSLHGEDGWAGLLDPLDSDLRRELLRYGDFVQAAYQAFHSLPTASARHRGLMLPDRSYRPTRSLFATSALSMPPWAKRPNTPEWLTQQSNWIGYVAVCESEREVSRMGRRDIAIVLRGTATCLEWAENLRASLVPLDGETSAGAGGEAGAEEAKVARGFLSLYKTGGEKFKSLSEEVMGEVRRLMEKYKGEELSITVVGHSLGGALALLVADEIATTVPDAPPVAVVSFGGPKVGNAAFVDRLKKSGKVNVLRIVNAGDVVTKVPGVAPRLPLTKEQYQHVGAELRIDSKNSPCLRPDAGPACRHDLEAYLHLIDGFTGTGRPFRHDARRSVIRLLQMQRGNVKKEYVNRARELGVDPSAPVDVGRSVAYGNCAVASPSSSQLTHHRVRVRVSSSLSSNPSPPKMSSLRCLLAASGRRAPASRTHRALFVRTIQILARPEPVSLHKLSTPYCGIVELRLERPDVKNAINWEVMRLLRAAVEKVEADSATKVVLITSSVPGVFCAGADLKALPMPTIAVIEGAALGGGLELALSCDLLICGENAILGLPETALAIIPGAGGTQRLPRIIGRSRAKELIFSGRRCDASEAVMMGLANYCVPAGEAYEKALEVAREITQKGPLGIRMAKKAIDQGMQAADMPSALAVEGECYEQLLHTEDRLEGLAAFAEKRKPVYSGK
uniref:Fungal lipase-type domain-containing protein n=2 Tax=Leersia perrieri TaxID=77586 RepID=A0A0D9VJ11_9ORYZ